MQRADQQAGIFSQWQNVFFHMLYPNMRMRPSVRSIIVCKNENFLLNEINLFIN